MKQVCVFCGSSSGVDPALLAAARAVGQSLARREIGLVYGGGGIGLMGALADACLEAGGRVVGVLPHAMRRREWGHTRLTELHLVDTMHERKALMNELSDGFIALPGGIGTLEEFFEAWTWSQLGVHRKPCGLLNVAGYFEPLLKFLDNIERHELMSAKTRDLVLVDSEIEPLIERMLAFAPPDIPRWLDDSET